MYSKIPGGSTVDIQGLKCHLPPVGMVLNVFTGKLEKRPIITRSKVKSEQYWVRQPVPEWLNKRCADEEKKQTFNPDYIDRELDEYRSQEWDRRLNGVWFMNDGEAVYLTGSNYMFLQWWKMDVETTKFRFIDLEYYYFQQYCIEDPNCSGMLELTKRRNGKSYRAGLFAYEYTSRTPNANSGIQSKTDADAKKLFIKCVIRPFKALPPFFRPKYDTSGGLTPKKELLFQATNIRGKNAEAQLDEFELQSQLDFQSSDILAYDGQKEHRYVRDECFKTFLVDVYEGLDVINYCIRDDEGKIIGKCLYTSTVEIEEKKKGRKKEEENIAERASKKLWDESDHLNKANGKETGSGLYRFFMPAYRTRCIDKYGRSDEKKGMAQVIELYERVKHDPVRLARIRRKEPNTIQDAFGVSAIDCHFNKDNLEEIRDKLAWQQNTEDFKPERGNFHWEDVTKKERVYWKADRNGRWERYWDFKDQKATNAVEKRGDSFYPLNKVPFLGTCDPYENDVTEEARNSKAAGHVYMGADPNQPESPDSDSFICEYLARPKSAKLMHDDMLKMCFYYGCPFIFENNKKSIENYFKDNCCEAFLVKLPGYENYGIPSTPENKQLLVELWEDYVEERHHKLKSIRLVEQLLRFDINKTRVFDLVMSSGWGLVGRYFRRRMQKKQETPKIEEYFRTYKHTG